MRLVAFSFLNRLWPLNIMICRLFFERLGSARTGLLLFPQWNNPLRTPGLPRSQCTGTSVLRDLGHNKLWFCLSCGKRSKKNVFESCKAAWDVIASYEGVVVGEKFRLEGLKPTASLYV